MRVGVVGVDAVVLVEGRELLALKMLNSKVQAEMFGTDSNTDISMEIGVRVEDIAIRDLQVNHCLLKI